MIEQRDGKRHFWSGWFERKSPEEIRVASEAKQLATRLLNVPRLGTSVLHEQVGTLADGMHIRAVLCNTANAKSLNKLLSAKHGADRVEVYITGATGPQKNYSVTYNFREQSIEFSEYQNHVNLLKVFKSVQDYVAYDIGEKVPFTGELKTRVLSQTAEIFQKVRGALPR